MPATHGGYDGIMFTPRMGNVIEMGMGPVGLWVALLITLACAGVMLVMLLTINRSIRELRHGAERFAAGDLRRRITVRGPRSLAHLADSLNQMASQLADRLSTVNRHRSELSAVHDSMVEGVLAIDREQNILSLNRAAAGMLDVQPKSILGRRVYEVIRNADLHDVIRRSFQENGPVGGEMSIELNSSNGKGRTDARVIQIQSALLHDETRERIGVVLVLHEVTKLRRLEAVRSDFVSNVSHEVKTPVSAIKAAVETLREIPSQDDPDAQRFLQIISRQADRLAAIVDDLLSLARIEQGHEASLADIKPHPLWVIVGAAVETCQAAADLKHIDIACECDRKVQARVNEQLLTQAAVNLIDNAIKYSDPETSVLIQCESHDGEAMLTVTDQGRGIEPKHLTRIFERFYRTDRARSRELGGTGLGLSIVKHIAEVHGGRVSVDSKPGYGSTFRIHLPKC